MVSKLGFAVRVTAPVVELMEKAEASPTPDFSEKLTLSLMAAVTVAV